MKNILLLLFLFSMFLLGAKSSNDTLPEEGVGVESVLQADIPVDQILPVVTEWPHESEACVDAESLARQFRICDRSQRIVPVKYLSLGKNSAYQSARKCLERLFHSINQTYTSLPFQSWSVSSDHYIFGMRRILI
ncbi:MAG: hypothetical protein IKW32_07935 [Bacteroidaceae bacterium]|nr:hypothetical protein [Bacteroidaceae bacterium]